MILRRPCKFLWLFFIFMLSGLCSPVLSGSQSTLDELVVNEHTIVGNEEKWVRFVGEVIVPQLLDKQEDQIRVASRSSWWGLKEGTFALNDPHEFSSCSGLDPATGGFQANRRLGPLETCTQFEGRPYAWQVGLAGVQVPNFSEQEVLDVVGALWPTRALVDTLVEVVEHAGFDSLSGVGADIIASGGVLRKSWLLRHPAVGITLVERNVTDECINGARSWCYGTGWEQTAKYAPTREAAMQSIADLATIFDILSQPDDQLEDCHTVHSGGLVPPAPDGTVYGLAWNWLSSERELLLSANCGTDEIKVNVGNGEETGDINNNHRGFTYVYHQGYWNNDAGGGWQPYSLTCSGTDTTKVASVWCKGIATASIPAEAKRFLGYACIWTGSDWQCGCTDEQCSSSYWQLQGIENTNTIPDRAVLNISFEPNPVPQSFTPCQDITPVWLYTGFLEETAGIGVTISSFQWDFYDSSGQNIGTQIDSAATFSSWFNACSQGSTYISPASTVCGNLCVQLGGRSSGSVIMTFKGIDDSGNEISSQSEQLILLGSNRAATHSRPENVYMTPQVTAR